VRVRARGLPLQQRLPLAHQPLQAGEHEAGLGAQPVEEPLHLAPRPQPPAQHQELPEVQVPAAVRVHLVEHLPDVLGAAVHVHPLHQLADLGEGEGVGARAAGPLPLRRGVLGQVVVQVLLLAPVRPQLLQGALQGRRLHPRLGVVVHQVQRLRAVVDEGEAAERLHVAPDARHVRGRAPGLQPVDLAQVHSRSGFRLPC